MAWRTETAWVCVDCQHVSVRGELLVEDHPFSLDNETVYGCPACRDMNLLRACDWDGCDRDTTTGTPTPDGYRHTCPMHTPTRTGGGISC